MIRVVVSLLVTCAVLTAVAQPSLPKIDTRDQALKALQNEDPVQRAAGVLYVGRTGLAGDGPLLVRRLSDKDPFVRALAEKSVWQVWSRSGDPEADRLLAAGVEEMEQGLLHQAIHTFSSVIERNPDFAEGWNKRATVLFLVGDFRASLADCDEVMKRNPQHFGALAGYGQIYLRLEQYDKAVHYFRRALEVNPNLTDLEYAIRDIENMQREKGVRSI